MGGGASKVASKDTVAADYAQLQRDYAALKKAHDENLERMRTAGPRFASDDKVAAALPSPERESGRLRKQCTTNAIQGVSKMRVAAKESAKQERIAREQRTQRLAARVTQAFGGATRAVAEAPRAAPAPPVVPASRQRQHVYRVAALVPCAELDSRASRVGAGEPAAGAHDLR